MKWLEIIELRTVDCNRDFLESYLQKLIVEINKETKVEVAKVYSRNLLNTDFSIHLIHDSNKAETNGSTLGLRIISGLKEFGLVNHSIWIEMQD
jgi:hypothetical protein